MKYVNTIIDIENIRMDQSNADTYREEELFFCKPVPIRYNIETYLLRLNAVSSDCPVFL